LINQATTKIKKEVDTLKKILFISLAVVLALSVGLIGCEGEEGEGEPATPTIKFGILGPMDQIQGSHMMMGAQMAADEINAATGKITSGTTEFEVELVEVDTDEIDNPSGAADIVYDALVSDEPHVCIGGFRTEAVSTYIDDIMAAEKLYFIAGAATYSLLSPTGYEDPGYKYVFRGTPFNDVFLVNNCYLMFAMVARAIQEEMGYSGMVIDLGGGNYVPYWTDYVKVAILSESLTWAESMRASAQSIIGGYGPVFGWEFATDGSHPNGEWLVTDTESYADVQTKLNQIKAAGAQVIFTIMSGPVGLTFGKAMGAVGVPAIAVGINVEAQDPGYWLGSEWEPGEFGANYHITMATWAPNVTQTATTAAFLDGFATKYGGLFPVYTASSYDMIYTIKKAIEATDAATWDAGTETATLDYDAVIAWLEDIDNAQVISTGHAGYYPQWDGATLGYWTSAGTYLPALNASQLADIYAPGMYDTSGAYNFTAPPYTGHDLMYGPRTDAGDPTTGWMTGLAIQWINGVQKGVWPNDGYDEIVVADPLETGLYQWPLSTTISRAVSGLSWTNEMTFPGIIDVVIPDEYITAWTP
jgi:branched-chain amino acid transport system substrate-binding protein